MTRFYVFAITVLCLLVTVTGFAADLHEKALVTNLGVKLADGTKVVEGKKLDGTVVKVELLEALELKGLKVDDPITVEFQSESLIIIRFPTIEKKAYFSYIVDSWQKQLTLDINSSMSLF